MNTIAKTFAFAAMAATGLAGAVVAQEAVQQEVTIQTVTTETSVQPAAMVATHTVQTIMASPKEDAKVTLIGTIGAKVGDETYAFTDRTGVIQVEIDDNKMPAGLHMGQTVRIDGEIDNTGFVKRIVQIDVEHVSLI